MPRDVARDALEAKLLLDNEYLKHLLSELEGDAVARVLQAAPANHEARQCAAAEARAIRAFRQALLTASTAGEAAPRPKRGTPA